LEHGNVLGANLKDANTEGMETEHTDLRSLNLSEILRNLDIDLDLGNLGIDIDLSGLRDLFRAEDVSEDISDEEEKAL
jgi:hypothetical protein